MKKNTVIAIVIIALIGGRMFGGRRIKKMDHAIPDDDFIHEETVNCPCQPYIHAIPGVGAAICHRIIKAEPVPDYIPQDWKSLDK